MDDPRLVLEERGPSNLDRDIVNIDEVMDRIEEIGFCRRCSALFNVEGVYKTMMGELWPEELRTEEGNQIMCPVCEGTGQLYFWASDNNPR